MLAGSVAGPSVRTASVERGEGALAERADERLVGGPRGDALGQDRRVGSVEANVEEWRPEHEQQPQDREEDQQRAAHHAPGESGPGAFRAEVGADLPDRERIDSRSEDGEERRLERQRSGDGDPDHERAGDPDRAQDHELEQDQPQQPQQHRQTGEEDGPAGGRDRDPNGRLDGLGVRAGARGRADRQLLAEPAQHQERVVHAQPQPQEGGQVEHEDAHRGDAGEAEDHAERDHHGGPADDERHARRDHRAEDEQERDRRERQADELRPPQVRLGDLLDVAVERRSPGERDLDPGRRSKRRLDPGQRRRRVVRRDVEQHHVVGDAPVGGHLRWGEQVAYHLPDIGCGRDALRGRQDGRLEGRVAGSGGSGRLVDEDQRRGRHAELLDQGRPRLRGLQAVEREPARRQHARRPGCERERDEDDQRPPCEHPPAPAEGEHPQALESGHRLGSDHRAGWMPGRSGSPGRTNPIRRRLAPPPRRW